MMDEKYLVLFNKMLIWGLVGSAHTSGVLRILRRGNGDGRTRE
jgi:hypothetical protein